jgi:serine/threonine protein kinase
MEEQKFLSFLDVDVDMKQCIGAGSFGAVYAAQDRLTEEELVYKKYIPLDLVENHRQSDIRSIEEIRRHGEFLVNSQLPYVVETKAFIISVSSQDDQWNERVYYLPVGSIKNFLNSLKGIVDNIQISCKVMKKAPGQELEEILKSPAWQKKSLPERLEHFDAIVQQCYKYLCESYKKNFVHRDINLVNLMYEMDTKKMTIIDTGAGIQLDTPLESKKRYSLFYDKKNPIGLKMTSNTYTGSEAYLSPAVKTEASYGAEIDAHSLAIVFLHLIDSQVFSKMIESSRNKPEMMINTTKAYLQFLEQNRSSSLLNDFLTKSEYATRMALVDAFFNLGNYVSYESWSGKKTPSEKEALFQNLIKSYQAAYPVKNTYLKSLP